MSLRLYQAVVRRFGRERGEFILLVAMTVAPQVIALTILGVIVLAVRQPGALYVLMVLGAVILIVLMGAGTMKAIERGDRR
jgi:hypothetical protein